MKQILLLVGVILLLPACTTINVDQIIMDDEIEILRGDSVVVLGRKNSGEIETEWSLVDCLGKKLQRNLGHVNIIPEREFKDEFYPWFEARTAPLHPEKFRALLDEPPIAEKLDRLKVRYLIWIKGSTERTASAGSMSCAIGPGGGGCFGFGTWEDTSDYETVIWDLLSFKEVARVSTEAVGTSYMPAFVVPIPMLARVEGDACTGMSKQIANFFVNDQEGQKRPR